MCAGMIASAEALSLASARAPKSRARAGLLSVMGMIARQVPARAEILSVVSEVSFVGVRVIPMTCII